MAGILSNAVSGLQASQTALRTTGHNISNANTAGYSRQTVDYTTRPEQRYGSAGFLGNGVNVSSIERVVNEFVNTQLRLDSSTYNQLNSYNANIGKLDKLLADGSSGLSGSLQSFFQALHNAADDPSLLSARQLVLAQADGLSSRFNSLYGRFDDISKGVTTETSTVVAQAESLAKSIAKLNQSISENNVANEGGGPNDLLDQRDEALRKLAELVSIQPVTTSSGDINVFIGNGQPLVLGLSVSHLTVDNSGNVQIDTGKTKFDVTREINGGKLGGLLDFRDNALSPSLNELGRIALVMSDQFNQLQSQGLDLEGEYGAPMFSDFNSTQAMANRVVASGNNKPPYDRVIAAEITDTNELTTSNYEFSIAPGTSNYTVLRESDGKIVAQGVMTGAYPVSIDFDGVSLNLSSGSFQGGDKFTIQPTRYGSRDLVNLLTRAQDLALAVPVRAQAASENRGSGEISSGSVLGLVDSKGDPLPMFATAGQLSPPLIIHFTSATTYDILDNSNPANPVDLVPPMRQQIFTPGVENQLFTQDVGETRIIGKGDRLGLPEGRTPAEIGIDAFTPAQSNGYLAERYSFNIIDPTTGGISTRNVLTQSGASAAQTAVQLNAIPGVSANAYTTASITDVNIAPEAFTYPLQIMLNGEALIQHVGTNLAGDVPDPNVDEVAFNDYLAKRINENQNLQSLGIRATSGHNPLTGAPEVNIVASSGVNLDFRFDAYSAEPSTGVPLVNNISINDSQGNPNVRLNGVNDPATLSDELSAVTVGGRIDLTLVSGISMSTIPSDSQLFGDSKAADFALSSYLGVQASITGKPQAGDSFVIDFNQNATNDNRNALAFTALESAKTMGNGNLSFSDGYAKLVEEVGTNSSLSKINTEASKSLLDQTQTLRDSYSGVNLDEEAADLIKFQQLYSANAQVISVARQLFDTLLQSL